MPQDTLLALLAGMEEGSVQDQEQNQFLHSYTRIGIACSLHSVCLNVGLFHTCFVMHIY